MCDDQWNHTIHRLTDVSLEDLLVFLKEWVPWEGSICFCVSRRGVGVFARVFFSLIPLRIILIVKFVATYVLLTLLPMCYIVLILTMLLCIDYYVLILTMCWNSYSSLSGFSLLFHSFTPRSQADSACCQVKYNSRPAARLKSLFLMIRSSFPDA